MATKLCGPDILMLVDQGIDTIVLQLLDDTIGDIKVGLIVLATDRLYTGPVDT